MASCARKPFRKPELLNSHTHVTNEHSDTVHKLLGPAEVGDGVHKGLIRGLGVDRGGRMWP